MVLVASLLEIVVAMVIAISIGGGWAEWEGGQREDDNKGGASFGPCLAPSCGEEAENAPARETPALLEAVFGVPLLISPIILGAVPAIVRSFSARDTLMHSIGYSVISMVLSSLLYLVIAGLLFIGILRYVLDPSLLPEIILFPVALLPIPWLVDRALLFLMS